MIEVSVRFWDIFIFEKLDFVAYLLVCFASFRNVIRNGRNFSITKMQWNT